MSHSELKRYRVGDGVRNKEGDYLFELTEGRKCHVGGDREQKMGHFSSGALRHKQRRGTVTRHDCLQRQPAITLRHYNHTPQRSHYDNCRLSNSTSAGSYHHHQPHHHESVIGRRGCLSHQLESFDAVHRECSPIPANPLILKEVQQYSDRVANYARIEPTSHVVFRKLFVTRRPPESPGDRDEDCS